MQEKVVVASFHDLIVKQLKTMRRLLQFRHHLLPKVVDNPAEPGDPCCLLRDNTFCIHVNITLAKSNYHLQESNARYKV